MSQRADETLEARHAAEHQVAAQAARLVVVRRRAAALGEGQDDRVEHAAARRIARKRRRDQGVGEEDAVAQAERGAPECADHEQADAPAEPALHDRVRDEEGDDDQQHARVREAGERLDRVDRAGQHRGRHGQQRRTSGAERRSG